MADRDAAADRYFSASAITGDRAVLGGPEAHHLAHVMRAGPGDRVTLFDGSGDEFPARIERVRRNRVELAVLGREPVDRELPLEITLGVAMPKGDRRRWLVEKAVELGVRRIVPLVTARSVSRDGSQGLERLRRTVVEAAKQCGRNRLMEISPPRNWNDFLGACDRTSLQLLAHPAEKGVDRADENKTGDRVTLAVGPEGGFTAQEVSEALATGWQTVDLGPRILRVETAAVMLVALLAGCRL